MAHRTLTPRAGVSLALSNKNLSRQIDAQRAIRSSVPKSKHFGDDPAIKTALDRWSSLTDDLATKVTLVVDLERQLLAARAAVAAAADPFTYSGRAFGNTLSIAVNGDADAISTFGVEPAVRGGPVTRENVPPTNVRASHGATPGALHFRWKRAAGAASYELQLSSGDPSVEASYATGYAGKQASFTLEGTVGQRLSARIRSVGIGPTPSAWSAPLPFLVR